MRRARQGRVLGVAVICLVANGCSGAAVYKPGDQPSGKGGDGAAGDAAPRAGEAGRPSNAQSDAGMTMQAAPVAGLGAAPIAGAAGAQRSGGVAGQAGTAIAGAGGQTAQLGAGTAANVGAAGAAGSSPCPLPSALYVKNGMPVSGAGCRQEWEGIVMTVGGRGLCTASFISDRHLISASHCYANDGPVSLQVSAPTWDGGAKHTFAAQVKRSGSEMELDIAIIDLGKPIDWATPARRFVLHAGMSAGSADLHVYGFGQNSSSGGAGTLRGAPKRATIHVTDTGRGTVTGMSADAQLCEGDSGGPALVEKTAPVIFGINQGADPPGNVGFGTCAAADWTIVFTNVAQYISFIEQALGKPCARKQVDDLDIAQCW